ncbi:glycosyltransferase family 2 protein [Methanofollis aquaemaris]|uniref:glycosyltransferase family 2 protein n=1 Tax=Methanofollis aquaemaris TaxID=126734 RepID=UPI00223EE5DF|nr:glycosyltransferase family 2 protein [Methanofollis aquaemaris]
MPFPGLRDLAVGHVVAAMPAFNEEHQIARTILAVKRYVDYVIVVDDGSVDATADLAGALGTIVVRHEQNRGYGGALRTIFEVAHALGADGLVVLDADGQHDPDEIPRLLKKLDDGVDVVIGSRFLKGSWTNAPAYRKFGMKVLNITLSFAGVSHLTDTQCGFRAYGRRAIEAIRISQGGMSAGSEILLQAAERHLKIEEVPVSVRYDLKSTSTLHPVTHGFSVMNMIVQQIFARRPLAFFAIPGFGFLLLGFISGYNPFLGYSVTSKIPSLLGIGSLVFLITGTLLIAVGLVLMLLADGQDG